MACINRKENNSLAVVSILSFLHYSRSLSLFLNKYFNFRIVNEYLEIYPYIEEKTNIYNNRKYLSVNIHTKEGIKSVPLRDWLNNYIN